MIIIIIIIIIIGSPWCYWTSWSIRATWTNRKLRICSFILYYYVSL